MSTEKISEIETQIYQLGLQLLELRKKQAGTEVPNYTFDTAQGPTTLLDLFADNDKLLAIHNMGQGCRYCTLWADGINGFLPHLESTISVVMLSKDTPADQRRIANARGWRFRTASHGGGKYIDEQSVQPKAGNAPGAVCYEKKGTTILRRNACVFGPGDLYCGHWYLLGLAGLGPSDWTPQFNYWRRPAQLEDGGDNIVD